MVNRIDLNTPIDLSNHSVELDKMALSDLELIANGAYSPLEGFMVKADYDSVVQNMRLSNGLPWSLPIKLAIDRLKAMELNIGETINLIHQGTVYGVMEEFYLF